MQSCLAYKYSVCIYVSQGRITVTGLIDREKGDTYTLTVVADDGGPKRGSTVVNVYDLLSTSVL